MKVETSSAQDKDARLKAPEIVVHVEEVGVTPTDVSVDVAVIDVSPSRAYRHVTPDSEDGTDDSVEEAAVIGNQKGLRIS